MIDTRTDRSPTTSAPALRLADVIGALSYALDLTEGQPPGHSLRCCWIGMHVGRALGMAGEELHDLYYTLLLKDVGCSSNAARLFELYGTDDIGTKHDAKFIDLQSVRQIARFTIGHAGIGMRPLARARLLWHLVRNGDRLATELVRTRCERGADIARHLGFSENVALGIQGLDEHWNGKGRPLGLRGDEIPLASRIALLAQVVDVFHFGATPEAALAEVRKRSGRWFDPRLVDVMDGFLGLEPLWSQLRAPDLESTVAAIEPGSRTVEVSEERLDAIAEGFGKVIDAKSPFTAGHSARVGAICASIGEELGVPSDRIGFLRRAGLLHDIGKLAVSNAILDKPGKLDEHEWDVMRGHPVHSYEILRRIAPFEDLALVAARHHEKLDGGGYPWGLAAERIDLESRIVTTADIFDALTADRPYRKAMPLEKAWKIMEGMVGESIDRDCLAALQRHSRDTVAKTKN